MLLTVVLSLPSNGSRLDMGAWCLTEACFQGNPMAAALCLSNRFVSPTIWVTGFYREGGTLMEKWCPRKQISLQTYPQKWGVTQNLLLYGTSLASKAGLMETAQDLQKYIVPHLVWFFFFAFLFKFKLNPIHTLMLTELYVCLMIWKFVQSLHLLLINQEQHYYLLLQLPTKLALITTCPWSCLPPIRGCSLSRTLFHQVHYWLKITDLRACFLQNIFFQYMKFSICLF